jgi:hypothetical protein
MCLRHGRIFSGLVWLCLTGAAGATPSGLNNIPTADTTPQGTFALQAFGTVGGEADDDFNLGFRTGIDLGPLDMEFGADSHISPGDAGPITVQAKLALPLGDKLPAIAIGSANTTFSRADANRAGETFGYLVVSQDLCYLRGHVGCGLQDGALLPSAGVLVPVIDQIIFETWANLPDNGDDASLTLKLNLVFVF